MVQRHTKESAVSNQGQPRHGTVSVSDQGQLYHGTVSNQAQLHGGAVSVGQTHGGAVSYQAQTHGGTVSNRAAAFRPGTAIQFQGIGQGTTIRRYSISPGAAIRRGIRFRCATVRLLSPPFRCHRRHIAGTINVPVSGVITGCQSTGNAPAHHRPGAGNTSTLPAARDVSKAALLAPFGPVTGWEITQIVMPSYGHGRLHCT